MSIPAGVGVAPLRPVLGRLVLLLSMAALVAVGRVVCLAVQGCAYLLAYDVSGSRRGAGMPPGCPAHATPPLGELW